HCLAFAISMLLLRLVLRGRRPRGQKTRGQGEGCQQQPGCSFTNVHHVSSLLETRTGPEVQRRGQRAGSWRKSPTVLSAYSRKAYIKVEQPSRRSASVSRHVVGPRGLMHKPRLVGSARPA